MHRLCKGTNARAGAFIPGPWKNSCSPILVSCMVPRSDLPVLYSFRRCPYAMRARLALWAAGLSCELREVDLKRKPEALLAVSPKATVPVLVLADGTVLEQSLDIMRHALACNDPGGWLPRGAAERIRQEALIANNDGPFKQALDRYKYPGRYGLTDGHARRESGSVFLQVLDDWLALHPALSGLHFGFADAAIAPFVRQWAHTDPQWFAQQPWAALQAWLERFEGSTGFAAVMHKYSVWVPGDPPLRFAAASAD